MARVTGVHMERVKGRVRRLRAAGGRAVAAVTRNAVRGHHRERGIVTSEYAVGLIAAVGFAGLLYKVVTGDRVRAALHGLVARALDVQL
ncbi:DUF4244 domain-containing protein [Streptomyces sp. NPDC059816]|uniref:DUF4244 domain-containing protein n=1 Tax=Streptomyces sp. NPDC059816 TaxID=3346960 RepID=UPI0036496569